MSAHLTASLRDALAELARLAAARLLAEPTTQLRQAAARTAVLRLEQARGFSELALRHLGVHERPVAWMRSPAERGLREARPLSVADLGAQEQALERGVSRGLERLRRVAQQAGCAPVEQLCSALAATLDSSPGPAERLRSRRAPRAVVRVFRGPRHVDYPPELSRGFSATEVREPRGCHDPSMAAPFFWCLSAREGMAAQACALSIVEHDGLPLQFHLDLARQAWDETRHAELFLAAARRWIPAMSGLPARDFWARAGRAHLAHGTPLPAPNERALYAGTWMSTLEDRLGFLQVDDEGSAVHVFRDLLDGPLCARDPQLAAVVRGVVSEEASHSRLGHTWLRHLIPDARRLKEHIAAVKQARAALTFASVLHERGCTAQELLGAG